MSKFKTPLAVAAIATAGVLGMTMGGATASSLVTGHDIKNGSVHMKDLAPGVQHKINTAGTPGTNGKDGQTVTGPQGPQGAPGKDGTNGKDGANGTFSTSGAIYRVENYQNGGGGSATVACANDDTESQKYVAIAGGVQGSESGKTETPSGFAVSSSFPGRMDWSTGEPKPGRLDGWIVFGNGQHTDTLKVWALCIPASNIPVQQVDLDN